MREDLSFEMASDLVSDMDKCIDWLDHHFIYSGQLFSGITAFPGLDDSICFTTNCPYSDVSTGSPLHRLRSALQ